MCKEFAVFKFKKIYNYPIIWQYLSIEEVNQIPFLGLYFTFLRDDFFIRKKPFIYTILYKLKFCTLVFFSLPQVPYYLQSTRASKYWFFSSNQLMCYSLNASIFNTLLFNIHLISVIIHYLIFKVIGSEKKGKSLKNYKFN